jgi:hypothetical protein
MAANAGLTTDSQAFGLGGEYVLSMKGLAEPKASA